MFLSLQPHGLYFFPLRFPGLNSVVAVDGDAGGVEILAGDITCQDCGHSARILICWALSQAGNPVKSLLNVNQMGAALKGFILLGSLLPY